METTLTLQAFLDAVTSDSEVQQATLDDYDHYLDALPPRWMSGRIFAFAEGYAPFCLYWKRDGRYFMRQLTMRETLLFCGLSGASLIS